MFIKWTELIHLRHTGYFHYSLFRIHLIISIGVPAIIAGYDISYFHCSKFFQNILFHKCKYNDIGTLVNPINKNLPCFEAARLECTRKNNIIE